MEEGYERIRSKISGETFTTVSDHRKGINGDHQSAGDPEPAQGHRAFSDGYPRRTRGVFSCLKERLWFRAPQD